MAVWQYEIDRVSSIADEQLEIILNKRGQAGWELVQALASASPSAPTEYRLIFKSARPQVGGTDMGAA